jgi:F-type H+-transporting ATPase subunit delta
MPETITLQAKSVTKGVISYLKKSNRLNLLSQVARETARLSKANVDPNTAYISSAVALTPAQLDTLKSSLETLYKHPLNLVTSIDANLIAGLTVKVGDQLIDQSLASNINELGKKLIL